MIEWSSSAPMERIVVDNRYALTAFLGGGGMARVYLARDEELRRDVALKLLSQEYAEDAVFVKLFKRESRSAATLLPPTVVQRYDARRSAAGRPNKGREYVPGGPLKEPLAGKGPLEADEATRLASQVAQALRAAHERGIVHRDVKSR